MTSEHVDVLIVGAGLSGICAAYYVQTRCPRKSYAVIEARDAIGGTWDLFRYPGVRSDSDMHTLGYSFSPWNDPKAIADGPAILKYVRETAATFGIDQHIRFNHRLQNASWSSEDAQWTVEIARGAEPPATITCNFLLMCSGYYDYQEGFSPTWPGMESFAGRIIHPQKWPEDLDYAGKRVVVIGSGATAVTLVPAMAQTAAHVTMVQRSPTYIVSRPAQDKIANFLHRILPARMAHGIVRSKNIALGMYIYDLSRRNPQRMKEEILKLTRQELGPDYDVERDFSPSYNPWDQRLCLVPDSDLFNAIKAGTASIVTGQIDAFTPTGLRMQDGDEVPADIIITATGLNMRLMNRMQMSVDGVPVDLGKKLIYRGTMCSGVPNLTAFVGYANASWTLKCELIAQYACRLLNYMDRHGYVECLPEAPADAMGDDPVLPLASGYVQRALATLPTQGKQKPWRSYQNYVRDLFNFRWSRLNDGTMRYLRRPRSASRAARPQPATV